MMIKHGIPGSPVFAQTGMDGMDALVGHAASGGKIIELLLGDFPAHHGPEDQRVFTSRTFFLNALTRRWLWEVSHPDVALGQTSNRRGIHRGMICLFLVQWTIPFLGIIALNCLIQMEEDFDQTDWSLESIVGPK